MITFSEFPAMKYKLFFPDNMTSRDRLVHLYDGFLRISTENARMSYRLRPIWYSIEDDSIMAFTLYYRLMVEHERNVKMILPQHDDSFIFFRWTLNLSSNVRKWWRISSISSTLFLMMNSFIRLWLVCLFFIALYIFYMVDYQLNIDKMWVQLLSYAIRTSTNCGLNFRDHRWTLNLLSIIQKW